MPDAGVSVNSPQVDAVEPRPLESEGGNCPCRIEGCVMSISSPVGQFMPVAMPPEPVCRLSVSQYHEMIAAGILTSTIPWNSSKDGLYRRW